MRLILFLLLFSVKCAFANQLILNTGDFEVRRNSGKVFEFGAEYRWDRQLWLIEPMIGGLVTTKASKFLYAGGAISYNFNETFAASISFAPGLYYKGSGKNLGQVLEFKSQFELWWKLPNQIRIGAAVSHISNAGLSKTNPGQESLIAQISFPVG
jgi:hypothetical protein